MGLCSENIEKIHKQLARRKMLLAENKVPVQSEFIMNFGKDLGGILLDYMSPLAKQYMGICNTSMEPCQSAQISIEEKSNFVGYQFFGDVTKALTHKGITDIGNEMLKKFEDKHYENIRIAVAETSEFERFEYNKRLKFMLENEKQRHKTEVADLLKNFNEKMNNERKMLKEKFEKECSHQINMICQRSDQEANDRVDDAVERIRYQLMEDYEKRLEEIQKMIPEHAAEVSSGTHLLEAVDDDAPTNNPVILEDELNTLKVEFRKRLRIQKHLLTCRNMAEIIHIVCTQKIETQKKITEANVAAQNAILQRPADLAELDGMERNLDNVDCCLKLHENYEKLLNKYRELVFGSKHSILNRKSSCYGVFDIDSKTADEMFCTCASESSEESDENEITNDFSPLYGDTVNVNWVEKKRTEAPSDNNRNEVKIEQIFQDIPANSDLMLARKILSLFNLKELLENAFAKIIRTELKINKDTLQEKLVSIITDEFRKQFNEHALVQAISEITSSRKQSSILATADSLDLFKTKRRSIIPKDESDLNSENVDEQKIDVESNKCSVDDFSNGGIDQIEENEEKLEESLSLDNNSRISISTGPIEHESSSIKINSNLIEKKKFFWDGVSQLPKYMRSSQVDQEYEDAYMETTDEQWQSLMKKIQIRALNEDRESITIPGAEYIIGNETSKEDSIFSLHSGREYDDESERVTTDDDSDINSTSHCDYIGKLRIRSIIDMLEQNDDVSKILYRRKNQ